MITEKAKSLGSKLDRYDSSVTDALMEELKQHSCPTKEEFCSLVRQGAISPETLWEMIVMIPQWEERNKRVDFQEARRGRK